MSFPEDIYLLAQTMMRERHRNSHKGDWQDWQPTMEELLSEIDHHLAKLKKAAAAQDVIGVREFSADLGNYCSKVFTSSHLFSDGGRSDSQVRKLSNLNHL